MSFNIKISFDAKFFFYRDDLPFLHLGGDGMSEREVMDAVFAEEKSKVEGDGKYAEEKEELDPFWVHALHILSKGVYCSH